MWATTSAGRYEKASSRGFPRHRCGRRSPLLRTPALASNSGMPSIAMTSWSPSVPFAAAVSAMVAYGSRPWCCGPPPAEAPAKLDDPFIAATAAAALASSFLAAPRSRYGVAYTKYSSKTMLTGAFVFASSKKPITSPVLSASIDATMRLDDVLMSRKLDMHVASVMGSNRRLGGRSSSRHTRTTTGVITATCGTLLRKGLTAHEKRHSFARGAVVELVDPPASVVSSHRISRRATGKWAIGFTTGYMRATTSMPRFVNPLNSSSALIVPTTAKAVETAKSAASEPAHPRDMAVTMRTMAANTNTPSPVSGASARVDSARVVENGGGNVDAGTFITAGQ
mmetsp:Transcript_54769/g.168768  ORF Transcript_54769/g.168768 Transcript_54769/m.168768 type:complete len:339 (-) Transcript_54769:12-1028(-)